MLKIIKDFINLIIYSIFVIDFDFSEFTITEEEIINNLYNNVD